MMQSGSDMKSGRDSRLSIEDFIPICPISSTSILEQEKDKEDTGVIGEDGHFYDAPFLKKWVDEHGTSPVTQKKISTKTVPVTSMRTTILSILQAYNKSEKENNELREQLKKYQEKEKALEIKSQLDEKSGASPREQTQQLLELSQLINQKEREQTAALVTQKRLKLNLLRKEKSLKEEWDNFNKKRTEMKSLYKKLDEGYKKAMLEIVQEVSPLTEAFKKLSISEDSKNKDVVSFIKMDKTREKWKEARESYFKEINELIEPRAILIRKTLRAAYSSGNKEINGLMNEFQKAREEKIRTGDFASKKFAELSYVERWERLNAFMQNNASKLKQLKEDEAKQTAALFSKLQEEQLNTLGFFGGKEKEEKLKKEAKILPEKPIFKLKTLTKENNPELWKAIDKKNIKEIYRLLTSEKELYTDVLSVTNEILPLSCYLQKDSGYPKKDAENFKKVINYLIECGENINRHDHNEDTALHWAAYNNDLDLVKYFLEKGADPSLKNRKENKPGDEEYNVGVLKTYPHIREYLNKVRKSLEEKALTRPPAFAPSDLNGSMRPG
jgi:hypothetical protein